MNKKWKMLTTALVVGLLTVAFVGVASAAGPVTPIADCTGEESRLGGGGNGMGVYFGQGALDDVVSDLLGLSAEDIHAQRLEGKSLAEIAASAGVSEEALVATLMAAKGEIIQQLVADGTITQERADFVIQTMEAKTIESVNRIATGPFAQTNGGMGQGGMYRWAHTS